MMRLCHSFSTRPLGVEAYNTAALRRLIGNVWYFALSVAYAKRSGAYIVLHTDTFGKAMLGHLPYDEIHLTLDDMPADISPRFWAAGKIFAQEAEPIGSLHIDGDVFIKRADLLADIEHSDWGTICQHRENDVFYKSEYHWFERVPGLCAEVGLELADTGAFNCGIIGWRDAKAKARYIAGYKALTIGVSKAMRGALLANSKGTPDLIAEQLWAKQCADISGTKVRYLFDGNYPCRDEACRVGFQHVLTSRKYNDIDKVKTILLREFPAIYNSTYKLCKNL